MTTIQFTDGTTTLDLTRATGDYALLYNSWSPRVARRRRDGMAGRSPYENVRETMDIKVVGTTAADCLGNLRTLAELFDQANVWYDEPDNNTAVKLQIQPTGSSTTVSAVIWDTEITHPPNFTHLGATSDYEMFPVTLSFTRTGLWLGATETETAGPTTGNPAILTSTTFTDTATIPWPYDGRIAFSGTPDAANNGFYVAFTNATNKINVIEGEDGANSNMTDTAVAGSSGGNVARTNVGASTAAFYTDTSSSLNTSIRKIEIFAMVRNNSTPASSNISYTMTPVYTRANITGKTTLIDTSSQSPRLVYLGSLESPIAFNVLDVSGNTINIQIEPSISITSGNTLDLDYVVLVGVDESTRIVFLDSDYTDQRWQIKHRLDSHPDPYAYVETTAAGFVSVPNHNGNILLAATSNVVASLAFGPVSGDFTIQNTGGAELNASLQAVRSKAYLTPL